MISVASYRKEHDQRSDVNSPLILHLLKTCWISVQADVTRDSLSRKHLIPRIRLKTTVSQGLVTMGVID